MKRFSVFSVMLVFFLALGLVLASCDFDFLKDAISGGNQDENVVGTWTSSYYGEPVILIFNSNSTYIFRVSGYTVQQGVYTMSGNTVTLYDEDGDVFDRGTISGNSMSFYGITFTKS